MSDQDQTSPDPQGAPPPGEHEPLLRPAPRAGLFIKLRTYFLTGIVVTAPISLTIYLTWEFVNWVDNQVTPLLPARYNPEKYLPFGIPGLGLVMMVVFLTFVGFITANFFGRTLIHFGESLVNRMPVVRTIYNALKQILETVLQQSSTSFRQVVLVEYPRRGIWALAFVSADSKGEVSRQLDEDLINVFLPTTPNPTSGFLLVVPRRDVVFLEMTVEEAAKFIISAGVVMPDDPRLRPKPEPAQPRRWRDRLGSSGSGNPKASATSDASQPERR
ncbi:MAG TPA: DUF502 domain-containing protein [Alphaproteobacteria bacterium]|nr:DUF502 domain-containing protein [Alphaproteobacteria bacterium]